MTRLLIRFAGSCIEGIGIRQKILRVDGQRVWRRISMHLQAFGDPVLLYSDALCLWNVYYFTETFHVLSIVFMGSMWREACRTILIQILVSTSWNLM